MTEENREYRTSQIMLRNQFHGKDKFKIPIIPKGNFRCIFCKKYFDE